MLFVPLSVYKTARQRHKRTSERKKKRKKNKKRQPASEKLTNGLISSKAKRNFGGRERNGNIGGSVEPSFLVRCAPTTKFYRKERPEREGAREGAGMQKETLARSWQTAFGSASPFRAPRRVKYFIIGTCVCCAPNKNEMRATEWGAKNVPWNGIKDGEKNAYRRSGGSSECTLSSFHSVERFAASMPLFIVCMAQFFLSFPPFAVPAARYFVVFYFSAFASSSAFRFYFNCMGRNIISLVCQGTARRRVCERFKRSRHRRQERYFYPAHTKYSAKI